MSDDDFDDGKFGPSDFEMAQWRAAGTVGDLPLVAPSDSLSPEGRVFCAKVFAFCLLLALAVAGIAACCGVAR